MTDGAAGLFRAEDAIEGDTYVVGWIIDADENVVGTGARQKGKSVQTLQPPKAGQALAAKVGANAPVAGRRVNGSDPKKTAAVDELSAVDRNQLIQEAAADAQAVAAIRSRR